jgi:hypothetical protein
MPIELAGVLPLPCESLGMKKHIREMLDDLNKKQQPPAAPPVVPQDLESQDLSSNPAERVRQLDQQAQDAEVRETLE